MVKTVLERQTYILRRQGKQSPVHTVLGPRQWHKTAGARRRPTKQADHLVSFTRVAGMLSQHQPGQSFISHMTI